MIDCKLVLLNGHCPSHTRDDIMWSFNSDDHPNIMGHGYGTTFGSIYSARPLDDCNNVSNNRGTYGWPSNVYIHKSLQLAGAVDIVNWWV